MDSSLWPQRTVPKLPSGTNGCQTLKTATLNTFYFCQKRPLCQPPPSPTPPPYSHFVRKVKLRLAYRLAFVIYCIDLLHQRAYLLRNFKKLLADSLVLETSRNHDIFLGNLWAVQHQTCWCQYAQKAVLFHILSSLSHEQAVWSECVRFVRSNKFQDVHLGDFNKIWSALSEFSLPARTSGAYIAAVLPNLPIRTISYCNWHHLMPTPMKCLFQNFRLQRFLETIERIEIGRDGRIGSWTHGLMTSC